MLVKNRLILVVDESYLTPMCKKSAAVYFDLKYIIPTLPYYLHT